MSALGAVLVALAAIAGAALLAAAAALFSPIVVTVDSARSQLRVRWLFGMEFRRPLRGGEGETKLTIAGKRVPIRARKAKPKRKKPAAPRERRRGAPGTFFYRCLRNATIRRRLLRQLARLRRGIFRSAGMTRRRVRVSLPDPAMTGMLYGFSQFAWFRRTGIEPNFTGANGVFLEIRLRPYRIVKAVLSFLTGLPYRAMFREWRSTAVRAPAR